MRRVDKIGRIRQVQRNRTIRDRSPDPLDLDNRGATCPTCRQPAGRPRKVRRNAIKMICSACGALWREYGEA